jgi:hypothetical protein
MRMLAHVLKGEMFRTAGSLELSISLRVCESVDVPKKKRSNVQMLKQSDQMRKQSDEMRESMDTMRKSLATHKKEREAREDLSQVARMLREADRNR